MINTPFFIPGLQEDIVSAVIEIMLIPLNIRAMSRLQTLLQQCSLDAFMLKIKVTTEYHEICGQEDLP